MLTRQVYVENFSQFFINIQQTVNEVEKWHGLHNKALFFDFVINAQNFVVILLKG